jgi:ABC-type glycerol-3-phosphate transport system substrate-binding protein
MFACLFGLGLDKKRGKTWMLCLLLLMACILPAACGGESSSKPTPQSYVVTVTGASGSITHTITVNVTVGQ